MATEAATKAEPTTKSHSVRVPNELWALAEMKAARENIAMNRVMIELLEGWRRNVYVLPKRKTKTERVYAAPAGPSAAA
jgi:hypothetical protein